MGCGWIARGFPTTSTSVIGNLPFIWGVSLWEAVSVVSQGWSFPTALFKQGAGGGFGIVLSQRSWPVSINSSKGPKFK